MIKAGWLLCSTSGAQCHDVWVRGEWGQEGRQEEERKEGWRGCLMQGGNKWGPFGHQPNIMELVGQI